MGRSADPQAAADHHPFMAPRYDVAGHRIAPLTAAEARRLAEEMAGLDPWARLGISAASLAATLGPGADSSPYAVRGFGLFDPVGEMEPLGAAAIRPRFLNGPYLALIFVRPGCQSRGTGRAALAFMEEEARRSGANGLWVSVSAFNERAFAFYRRFGFEEIGRVPGLIRPGEDERLMRKPL
ncbi:GNAT family N-acetyltransferase [Jiella sonneratiae]|uniref:GNAT family N-acetyltransferase n=1 Tax=Jiella sonneratiae TaxID=2816856 RepID=A0ABS3J940_9HYPH|nr:GNAT family N-acetyltransferase [Jiella sonneratiae]MBO0906193.1 GNAT family N-acetyltransferase [Jiella sonneratiae]